MSRSRYWFLNPMEWLKLIYETFGASHPGASLAVVVILGTLIGGTLAGGIWHVAATQYGKSRPAVSQNIAVPNQHEPAAPAEHPTALSTLEKSKTHADNNHPSNHPGPAAPREKPSSATADEHVPEQKPSQPAQVPAPRENTPMPSDRSIKIQGNNQFTNSPMVTGDNSKIDIRTGPPPPVVLTEDQQGKMAAVLKEQPGIRVALQCFGSGCYSLESFANTLRAGGWEMMVYQTGNFSRMSDSLTPGIDITTGIHVMQNGAPNGSSETLQRALRAASVEFDAAPWQPPNSIRKRGETLCLLLGAPR